MGMRMIVRRFAYGAFVALLGLIVASRSAYGTAMLFLSDGVKSVAITDQTGTCVGNGCGTFTSILGNFDLASGVPGEIGVSGRMGVWAVNVSTGITKGVTGSPIDPKMVLNSVDFSVGAGTMTIKFTDSGFGPIPAGSNFIDAIGGTTEGAVSATELYDAAGGAFTGVQIASLGPFFRPAFGGMTNSVGVPGFAGFSLTQIVTITHDGTGMTNFDYSKDTAPVPEPSAVLLLGSGLAGFGYLRRRRLFRA